MNRFPPPLLALVCLGIEWLLSRYAPMGRLDAAPVQWAAYVLIAVGALLGVASLGLFAKARTTLVPHGEPSSFVASGPYRLSRNPMYLGLTLALFGGAGLFGAASALIAPLLFVAVVSAVHIPPEERALVSRFGDEYRAYRQRVRRWI